jgi:hypothetical protein
VTFEQKKRRLAAKIEFAAGRAMVALVGMSVGAALWPQNILKGSFGLEPGGWNIWLAIFDPGFLEVRSMLFVYFLLIYFVVPRMPPGQTARSTRRRTVAVLLLLYLAATQIGTVGRILIEGAGEEAALTIELGASCVTATVIAVLYILFRRWRRSSARSSSEVTELP